MNLFNHITFIALLSACVSNKPTEVSNTPPDNSILRLNKYKVGDCLMLIDPTSNIWKSNHFIRVEKIDLANERYHYRWFLDNNKWDSGLSTTVGQFDILEKITVKIDCNKVKVRPQTSDKYM